MSADQVSPPNGLDGTPASRDKPVRGRTQDSSSNDSIYACYAEVTRDLLPQSPASMRTVPQHICDPTQARCIHHQCEKQQAHDSKTRRDSHIPSRAGDRESAESGSSALNIEHIVFEDHSCCSPPKYERLGQTAVAQQAHENDRTNTLALNTVDSFPRPPTRSYVDERSAHSRWGTKGSLYDGTGYGNATSSSSARPSISSVAPESAAQVTGEETRMPNALIHGTVAIAREHDNLEEAIRAYAALEAKCAAGISEVALEDMVAEVQADVELVNDMADHSLSA